MWEETCSRIQGGRLAQIRAQVSGKAALAVRAGKKQVPFSGSQLSRWQDGNKTVCLPCVFPKCDEESNKVTGRRSSQETSRHLPRTETSADVLGGP